MALDPHVRRLLRALSAGGARDVPWNLAQRRAALRDLMRLAGPGPRVARCEDGVLPGPGGALCYRLYAPTGADGDALPGIVFFHGGGFVAGDLDTHDALCRALCQESRSRLVAVAYRLAPEHKFPAAVEDAHAAALWVARHAAALGIDPARIAIAGDSAGATLAAAVCHLLAARQDVRPALQVLLCPILDWAAETPSRRAFAQGYLVDRAMMQQDLAQYLPAGHAAAHPQVSPLRAADRGNQPPACIHTAECDPLRDEGDAYAALLRARGIAVQHTCHPGMVHLFYGLGALVPHAAVALGQIGAEIRTALSEEASDMVPQRPQHPDAIGCCIGMSAADA